MIPYQILRTSILRIVWQTVRRITNQILGITGLIQMVLSKNFQLYIRYFKRTLTKSRLQKFSCSTSCSFQKELQWLITNLKLILYVLCEHDPVQWVRHKRTTHVECSTVSEQCTDYPHVHEICSSCNKWQWNVHCKTDERHKKKVHIAAM